MKTMYRLLFVAALMLLSAAASRADVTLPDVLSSGMVLQRGMAVPVWGRAEPGEAVTVRFAGQTKKATAGADGRWRVVLDALKASATPASMTVAGRNTIEL
jgi:sialate O-acetylesterase